LKDSVPKTKSGDTEYYGFYLAAYSHIDLLGIKKDKINNKNGLPNLISDGLHSYYARYCDILVSADESLRVKSKALYELFGCSTRALSVEQFFKELSLIGAATEDSFDHLIDKLVIDIKEAERSEIRVDEDGREQCGILTTNRYFNFFDYIHDVKEAGYTQYMLLKRPTHILSY
jgi:hypothetical protein